MTLKAPFPWYGGKSRLAAAVWERLGSPTVYAEPFAGSLAVLLARPGGAGQRELVCDTDGGICNFWRAIVLGDPEEVAFWADWPSVHQDLTARHKWLRAWLTEHAEQLTEDPFYFDPQVAGWWVWGLSIWIGGGWCQVDYDRRPFVEPHEGGQGVSPQRRTFDQRPHVDDKGGGNGVSAQGRIHDKRPYANDRGGGRGVSPQRKTNDKIPHINPKPGGRGVSPHRRATGQIPHVADRPGGQGIAPQRTFDKRPRGHTGGGGAGVSAQSRTRPELVEWFYALQERLKAVVVLNRSWESALTPTLLMHTPTSPKPPVGVFLDPPYLTADRDKTIYVSDEARTSDEAARASYEWALANGERFRIAYCAHAGDFPTPDGWEELDSTFAAIRRKDRQHRRDRIIFSPACFAKVEQGELW